MPFLEGTQPVLGCDYHGANHRVDNNLRFIDLNTMYIDRELIESLPMPVLRDEEITRGLQTQTRPRPISPMPVTIPVETPSPVYSTMAEPEVETAAEPEVYTPASVFVEPVTAEPVTVDAVTSEAVTADAVLELPSHNPLLD